MSRAWFHAGFWWQWAPQEILRCFPVATCFSLSQTFTIMAYSSGAALLKYALRCLPEVNRSIWSMKNPEVRCKKEAIQHFNTYSYLVTEPIAAVVVDDFVVSALTCGNPERSVGWRTLPLGVTLIRMLPSNIARQDLTRESWKMAFRTSVGFIQVLLRDTTESYTNFD